MTKNGEVLDSRVEKGGLGFHGGLALEFKAGNLISLLLEMAGRYARFSGFTGTGSDAVSGNATTTKGTLYYFEPFDSATGAKVYSMVYVFSEAPGGVFFIRRRLGIPFCARSPVPGGPG